MSSSNRNDKAHKTLGSAAPFCAFPFAALLQAHLMAGRRYQEKFYFNPGDTGFQVFSTKYAKIGVAVCWDQWFPEAARCMALMGAEVAHNHTFCNSSN